MVHVWCNKDLGIKARLEAHNTQDWDQLGAVLWPASPRSDYWGPSRVLMIINRASDWSISLPPCQFWRKISFPLLTEIPILTHSQPCLHHISRYLTRTFEIWEYIHWKALTSDKNILMCIWELRLMKYIMYIFVYVSKWSQCINLYLAIKI